MIEQFLILRLSKRWRPDLTPEELYDVTRMWWVTTLHKASGVSRVLAVANGEVKEVYEPTRWMPAPDRGLENRVGFEGHVAADRDRWVGVDVSFLFKPGAANPVRYVDAEALDRTVQAMPSFGAPSAVEQQPVAAISAEEPGLADRIVPLLDAFEADPLFAMSRAAQELYHSNVLAWLIENVPGVGGAILCALGIEDVENSSHCEVWREKRNFDLLVQTPKDSLNLVVENKMYSIPSLEQLERYTQNEVPWCKEPGSSGAPHTGYVLLSMMEPTFPLPHPWRHVSYLDLAEVMSAAPIGGMGEHVLIIERYIGLLRRLAELSIAIDPRQSLGEPFSIDALGRDLEGRRFDGPLQKMRYTGLVQEVARIVGRPHTFEVGVTRAKGLASFAVPVSETRYVGWQLQESQLRLFVLIQDRGRMGKGDALKLERAALVERDHSDWLDFDLIELELGAKASVVGNPSEFRHFAPDFVYRYRKVDPSTTTEELARVLAALTLRAIKFSTAS